MTRVVARRFLVLQTLLLWQGGFLFYSAVVVPEGTDVLGSAAAQGVITRRVTAWLNPAGLAYLAAAAWDLALTRDPWPRRVAARWWLWAAAVALLYGLFVLHNLMSFFMDPAGQAVQLRREFRVGHVLYMWASTLHWLFGLAAAYLTLAAWAAEDRRPLQSSLSPTTEVP